MQRVIILLNFVYNIIYFNYQKQRMHLINIFYIKNSNTSDVNYLVNDQSFSIVENTTSQITPDLPCSIAGTTSISFSIGNYITSAPSWVTINDSTGTLSILAPGVVSDTEYNFYINSMVGTYSSPVQKLIKLKILNCTPSNCQKCVTTSSSTCEICNSGYKLDSGAWKATPSEVAQILSTTIKWTAAAIFVVTLVLSSINTTNMASLWMAINQLQLFLCKLILFNNFNKTECFIKYLFLNVVLNR